MGKPARKQKTTLKARIARLDLRQRGRAMTRAVSRSLSKTLRRSLRRLSISRAGRMPLPTLGGRQFWSDRLVYAGWRIQENVITGHARLLDARNIRRAWGTFAQCLARFEELRLQHSLSHDRDHVVIMVHGLLKAHGMFKGLGRWLGKHDIDSLGFTYASTRHSVCAHAKALCRVLDHLGDIKSVTFVTYSLGALVVRKALAKGNWRDRIDVRGVFMIAPPNRGARLAEVLVKRGPARWLMAPVASDLMPARARRLPKPDVAYAIVAGGTGKAKGFNPFLAGYNDGYVKVAETRLSTADDLVVVRAPHGLLVNHKTTKKALARFLAGGKVAG